MRPIVPLAERVLSERGAPEGHRQLGRAPGSRYIEDTPPTDVAAMLGAPFFAAFHTIYAFMAPMLQRRDGVIVHVRSPASIIQVLLPSYPPTPAK